MPIKDPKKLQEFMKYELKKIADGVNKATGEQIGQMVVDEMKGMISRGISPIEGAGRFPEYKGSSRARSLSSQAKAFKKEAKSQSDSPFSRRNKKALENKSRRLQKTADQLKKRSYPQNVQKKFPGKRNRPVNLFLSGDFLKTLKKFISGKDGEKIKIEIGFDDKRDEKSVKLESGHREGVNTQPKRPIIPEGEEELAQRIQRLILKSYQESLAKFFKAKRR